MKTIIVFTILIAATILACKKSRPVGENEYVTLTYKQTYCSDPWKIGSTDSITLKNLSHYLDSSMLYVASLNIRQENAADECKACMCKTGKTIYVSTLNSDNIKARYMALGFR